MPLIENLSKEETSVPHKAKTLLSLLSKIEVGQMKLIHPDGQISFFKGTRPGHDVTLNIYDWEVASAILGSGDIGLGETYQRGLWSCAHIDKLIEFGIANQSYIEQVSTGNILNLFYYRFRHWLNRNTKKGSQKNIHAHYDLGNHFYRSWLDSTMTYSSALFDRENLNLEQAQIRKYNVLLDTLDANAGDHILEIGCGWGGLIEQARKRDLKVTGVTLSQEQFKYCQEKFKNDSHVDIKLCDYRDLEGKYDHIVSIEMFEAIGERFWSVYFDKVKSLLKESGRAAIQTIVMNDRDFNAYRKGSDFIQQMIFPGGMLPCPRVFKALAFKAKLKVDREYFFGLSYAKTLNQWDLNYRKVKDKLLDLGFDEEFNRLWHFYLKYCEGGFNARKIDVCHFILNNS